MVFQAGSAKVLYDTLVKHYEHLLKFLMRFDHYLEMLIWDADFIQKEFPGQALDYTNFCTKELPDNCRIVMFPRSPKPHDVEEKVAWVKPHWHLPASE